MSDPMIALTLLSLLIALLASGIWVAVSLSIVGLAGLVFFSNAPSGLIIATAFWGHSYSWALTALPLFILMGEILLRSRMSDDMFTGLVPWLSRAPGRLLHVNVFGCAIFAAVSGSNICSADCNGRLTTGANRKLYGKSYLQGQRCLWLVVFQYS